MEKLKALLDAGLIVGKRDPLMNTLYPGAYMVTQPYPAGHTQLSMMGHGCVWCMVWDNLDELIEAAWWMQSVSRAAEEGTTFALDWHAA